MNSVCVCASSHLVPSRPARGHARFPERSVLLEQMRVEARHVLADEGLQRVPEDEQTPARLQPIGVLAVVETKPQLRVDHLRAAAGTKTSPHKVLHLSPAHRPLCARATEATRWRHRPVAVVMVAHLAGMDGDVTHLCTNMFVFYLPPHVQLHEVS